LGTKDLAVDQKILVQTTWIVGGDTLATWQLEVGKSTALAASTQVVFVKSPTGQSGQYVTTNELKKDYRLRARVNSTFTASVTASIIAERLT
jgi:NADH:ubiquinone oxidoreductase subunit D